MRYLLISGIFASLILVGCSGEQTTDISQLSNAEVEQYRPPGRQVASTLMKSLKSELSVALERGGPTEAVEFCHTRALPLTDAIADSFDVAISVKRTTNRYRNPANAPDKAEQAALEHFEEVLTTEGSLPSSYMQKISTGDGVVYRYYHPMQVAGVCLTCHGPREQMSDKLRSVIDQKYPNDRATGYGPGDFRGVIRVEMRPLPADG